MSARTSTRQAVVLAIALGVTWSTAGCGADESAAEVVAATSSPAPSTSEPVVTTESAPSTTAEAVTSTPVRTTASPTAPSSTSGGVLTPVDEGRELTLNDFFNPSPYWSEDRYDIADQKDVAGIATPVSGCNPNSAEELELRLGNNFSRLTFSYGQSNDSTDSDQNVSVEVVGNNAQIDIQSVPFNEITSFDIPVEGVNALKIRVVLDGKVAGCGGSVIGVITDPELS